uniref:Uncharacterized protein n=1 Tax=Angiostrongylus cantonensis TaxID=6313 RepID=A0A158PCR6_ANGCA
MLAGFDKGCGNIGLGLNLRKTMFMRNGLVSFAPFTLNGTNISECSSYVYLGREINMMNDLASELSRRKRAAWGAFKSIEDVVKRTKNTRLRAHLFDSTVLPALTYASETWSLRKQDENSLSVIERAVKRTMLGVSRFTLVAALQNKARLPTGISAVRPHLEQVDNVPLLVGLITDCTPEANLQMLEIMQEYGELVLAIGSSLSLVNTAIFLRGDISISVLPLGDWVCCQNPAPSWQQAKEAATNLMGVASDFLLQCDQVWTS